LLLPLLPVHYTGNDVTLDSQNDLNFQRNMA
jgi:hypothetical protein